MRNAIHQQFGAALDALEGTIGAIPDEAWHAGSRWQQPWYLAFHTLFWLDLYLSESAEAYRPPPPFTRGELEPGVFPERPYRKDELLGWLDHCRHALRHRLSTLATEADLDRRCTLHWGVMRAGELVLYNLRHVQHHVAQLNWLVRLHGGEPAPWIMRTDGLPSRA